MAKLTIVEVAGNCCQDKSTCAAGDSVGSMFQKCASSEEPVFTRPFVISNFGRNH
jgi:hypothetical protein